MTELLEQAVTAARALSPDMQDEIARLMLTYASGESALYHLTPDEEADLDLAEDEVRRGALASDSEVNAVFSKFRS